MSPFLCSGSHQAQRDCQPSALNCFVEAMSQCVPPIPIRPCVLKYLGKTHNLWLRSTLMLEQQAFEKGLSLHSKPKQSTEFYEQESITLPQQVGHSQLNLVFHFWEYLHISISLDSEASRKNNLTVIVVSSSNYSYNK